MIFYLYFTFDYYTLLLFYLYMCISLNAGLLLVEVFLLLTDGGFLGAILKCYLRPLKQIQ